MLLSGSVLRLDRKGDIGFYRRPAIIRSTVATETMEREPPEWMRRIVFEGVWRELYSLQQRHDLQRAFFRAHRSYLGGEGNRHGELFDSCVAL